MSIIGHTFTPDEQDEFIDRVHESNPRVFLTCLRFSLTQPQELLKVVSDCFAAQAGGSRVCVIEQNNVIAWPKKASWKGKTVATAFSSGHPRQAFDLRNRLTLTSCGSVYLLRNATKQFISRLLLF
jgi:hypothetical protein